MLGGGTDLPPEEAGAALGLDPAWLPHALVLVGYPDPGYVARPRPPVDLATLRARWVSGPDAGRETRPRSG